MNTKCTLLNLFLLLVISSPQASLYGQNADPQRLDSMVTFLASDELLGRGFGSDGGLRAAEFIREKFCEDGIEPFLGKYFHPFHHRTSVLNIQGNNVIGIIEGNDLVLKNEYIIIGGHYDHVGWEPDGEDTIIYNGADDNASGTATVIETGRILSANRDQLKRSVILIAFDGEESGLNGSRAFVRQYIEPEDPVIPREKVVAMFSLDMTGMYGAHGGVDLGGIELIENHGEILDKAISASGAEISKANAAMPNRTDTAPFGNLGIPAIHVFTGLESPYHKPEDDSDLLDYEGMARVADLMVAMTMELSTVGEVEAAPKLENIAERGSLKILNPGFTLNPGTSYHDYKNDFFKAKSVFACSAGFMLETRFTQWLALQPEILYEWSGSKIAGGDLRTHAVTVPVSLMITTPDEKGMGVRGYL